nr:hypothetical protein [Tanacetum cinerariifolium]
VPQDYNTSFDVPCLFIHILRYSLSLYPFTERYAQPYSFSCLIRQMVNTRIDDELAAAVLNALQTLLPQIRAEIREEFRTGSGPSGSDGNPPPVTIHTWLERFNKQKPCSFENATAFVDAENWISYMEKIFDVMGFFPRAEQERLKREYDSIRQTDTKTSAEFMQRFLRLAGFLGAAAGTTEEQAKNFQWGLRKSTLNHLMCIPFMDVAQVASVARNYKILHERDDDGAERPDKRQKSGDRHHPTTQQSSHRNHGHNNDRHGSDRRGGGDNHRSNNNYSANNNRSSSNGRDQRNRGQQSNRPVNSDFQQSRGPFEGYSYPADKKPGASGRVFAITEDHATKTSGVVRFEKKGKLAPRFVGPFEITERIGLLAYRLRLPEELNEPMEILKREFKKLKQSRIAIINVWWNSKRGSEFTWEHENQMKLKNFSVDLYIMDLIWFEMICDLPPALTARL